jgi:hypothetical protein
MVQELRNSNTGFDRRKRRERRKANAVQQKDAKIAKKGKC